MLFYLTTYRPTRALRPPTSLNHGPFIGNISDFSVWGPNGSLRQFKFKLAFLAETDKTNLIASHLTSSSPSFFSHSVVDALTTTRRVKRRSQTSMVDSLLSPQDSPTRSVSTSGPSSSGPSVSALGPPVVPFRLRKCSIVEEEEEDSEEKHIRIHRWVGTLGPRKSIWC